MSSRGTSHLALPQSGVSNMPIVMMSNCPPLVERSVVTRCRNTFSSSRSHFTSMPVAFMSALFTVTIVRVVSARAAAQAPKETMTATENSVFDLTVSSLAGRWHPWYSPCCFGCLKDASNDPSLLDRRRTSTHRCLSRWCPRLLGPHAAALLRKGCYRGSKANRDTDLSPRLMLARTRRVQCN